MNSPNDRSVGVIAIIIKDISYAPKVNSVISEYSSMIIGRMGLPYHERNLNIITLIVDATNNTISALTGKLGRIQNVTVKSTLAKL